MSRRIYPISYSIPEEMFQDLVNAENKKHDMAPLIPGKRETYIYDTEESYYEMYANSKYALTSKKGGWDCLRHYEIIASGCIPIFKDIILCPFQTMNGFPKKQVLQLSDEFNSTGKIDNYDEKRNHIYQLCRKKLTCKNNAIYFLHKTFPNVKEENYSQLKILMLSGMYGYRNTNYSRETLAIGLRRICGENFIEYPKLSALYKGCKNKSKYVGKGFTYGERLEVIGADRSNLERRIKNKEFDLVIYGKVGNKYLEPQKLDKLKYWNTVNNNYDKDHIVFLYGGDKTRTSCDACLLLHAQYGICFVREYQEVRFSRLKPDRSGAKILAMIHSESYLYSRNIAYGGAVGRPSKYDQLVHKNAYILRRYLDQCKPLCKMMGFPDPVLNYEIFSDKNITSNSPYNLTHNPQYYLFLYERCKHNLRQLSKDTYNVAIYVKRGDVTRNGKWSIRYVPNEYYVDLITRIKKVAQDKNRKIKISIFSEKKTDAPFDIFVKLGCELFLDTSLADTWNSFIMSDLLVTAPGAFSVVPALIRQNGNVIYTKNKYFYPLPGWIIANTTQEQKFVEELFN